MSSSSMTISPRFVTGAKTAERIPITIFAFPSRIASHCFNSWPADSLLSRTKTSSEISFFKSLKILSIPETSGVRIIMPRLSDSECFRFSIRKGRCFFWVGSWMRIVSKRPPPASFCSFLKAGKSITFFVKYEHRIKKSVNQNH